MYLTCYLISFVPNLLFLSHFMNEETKMCKSELLISYSLVVLGMEVEPGYIYFNCESKYICLRAFTFNTTVHCVLILCHGPASMLYLGIYTRLLHLYHALYLCQAPASMSHSTPTPVLIV